MLTEAGRQQSRRLSELSQLALVAARAQKNGSAVISTLMAGEDASHQMDRIPGGVSGPAGPPSQFFALLDESKLRGHGVEHGQSLQSRSAAEDPSAAPVLRAYLDGVAGALGRRKLETLVTVQIH